MSTFDAYDPYNDHYHEGPRSVPLRVLSLGMSRTATSSTQQALVQLGYSPSYHGFKSWRAPLRGGYAHSDAARWLRACQLKWETPPSAKRTLELHRVLDELLGNCQAAGDMPVVVFWRELWEMHKDDPEFKIILNNRPTDSWHKSWLVVVKGFTPTLRLKLLYVFDAPMRALLRQAMLSARYFWEVESKSDEGRKWWQVWKRDSTSDAASWTRDSAISRRIYEQHNADIIATIPPERLLLWGPQDGWEPLCAFLGRPVPQVKMPHVNDAAATEAVWEDVLQAAQRRVLRRAALFFGAAAALAGWWLRA